MSLNLNKVILAGRIVADPELKQTPSGASVCSTRIAVNRRSQSRDSQQQNEADFFNVTAWQNTAEFIAKYFRKGFGHLRLRPHPEPHLGRSERSEALHDRHHRRGG